MHYNDFGNWARNRFPYKIQKISIDAGFTCPNRDGRISHGGCIYCNNRSFNPSYLHSNHSISEQIEKGKAFFAHKYPDMKYLAYFQAYTNTYAPLDSLKSIYEEALECEYVVGIVIGTRPDCVNTPLLDYLEQLNRTTTVIVEYGVESVNDKTLLRINRGHDFACSKTAIESTSARGIITGAHIILGLPGENQCESIRQASIISLLPINILKIHQLQIIRNTPLADVYLKNPFHLYSMDEYIELVATYIQYLRKDIVLDRFISQSPPELLVAPNWGIKNHEFTDKLNQYLKNHNIYQGYKCK